MDCSFPLPGEVPEDDNMDAKRQKRYQGPLRATITGVADLFRRKSGELDLHDLPSLHGKRVLVTGASSGLGFASTVELAKRGAEVIMAVRSGIPHKGDEARMKSGSDKVHMVHMDLTDLEELKKLPGEIKKQFVRLDIVICNAAIVARKSRRTSHGLDEMFQVNYFAKFLLVNYLIEADVLNTERGQIPRIIFVASESHRNPEAFDWEGFGTYQPHGINQSVALYGYYKLLLLTMASELSRRLNTGGKTKCAVASLCPGPVNSNLAREAPSIFQPLLKLVFYLFFRSPGKACSPVIYLAAAPVMEGVLMDYLFLMNRKPLDEKATDPANGKRLWELSEQLKNRLTEVQHTD
jgi:NAD(P)-dependent dehydrogenase (short-subunit alcohol dehydrogenase family)